MNRVLSREQIRSFDRHAIETCHVPSLVLMENAGRAAAELILERLGSGSDRRVLIVCGAGNNGGDGFVVARHLLTHRAHVTVLLLGDPSKLKGDALANYQAWLGLDQAVTIVQSADQLAAVAASVLSCDVVVDAVFGTGLDRPVGEPFATAIALINQSSAHRLALDVPSGLDAQTGSVLGCAVTANETITFGALKLGMLTPRGAEQCGHIHVAHLGVPDSIVEHTGYAARLLATDQVAEWLTARPATVHKHAAGNVLAMAGSRGKLGAALLVARGALRAGAGLVTIASWPEAIDALESHVLETMTTRIDPTHVEASVDDALVGRRVVVVGPGFGTDDRALRAVEHVVLNWEGTKILDADGLTLFTQSADRLASAKGSVIITPHAGEMGRLLGMRSADVEADRFGAVREAVRITKCIVVLKGAHTIVAAPHAAPWVNASGSPVLATAGSGDVLGGVIAAMACGLSAEMAAVVGVHIHGLAGEAWQARHRLDRGLLASEIAEELPGVLASLLGGTPE